MEASQMDDKFVIWSYNYWKRKQQFALEKDIYKWWTVCAVEDGRFAYRIGDKSGEAAFGDLVVCPPNVWFHRRTIEPLTFHFLHFTLEDKPSDDQQSFLPAGILTLADTERLYSCYSYLRRLSDRNDLKARIWKQHLFQDIFHLVKMEQSVQPRKVSAQIHAEMLWAKDFIKGQAFGNSSMRALAEQLKISPVQLTRRFREAFGITPIEYLTKLRIDKASRLLEETTLSLDEIAQRAGYENGFYLSRVFSKNKGMSPSAYRKMRHI